MFTCKHQVADGLGFVVGGGGEVTGARAGIRALAVGVAAPVLADGQYLATGIASRHAVGAGEHLFQIVEEGLGIGLHALGIQGAGFGAAGVVREHTARFAAVAGVGFPCVLQMRAVAVTAAAAAVLDVPVRLVEADHHLAVVAHGGVVDGEAFPCRQFETGVEVHVAQHGERQGEHNGVVVALQGAAVDIEGQPHLAAGEFAHSHEAVTHCDRRGQALRKPGGDAVGAFDHVEVGIAEAAERTELVAFVAVDEAQEADGTQGIGAGAVFAGVGAADEFAQQAARALHVQIVVEGHEVEQAVGFGEAVGGGVAEGLQVFADEGGERLELFHDLRFGVATAAEVVIAAAREGRGVFEREPERARVPDHHVMRGVDEFGAEFGDLPGEHATEALAAAADAGIGFEDACLDPFSGELGGAGQTGHAGTDDGDATAAGNHPAQFRGAGPGGWRHRSGGNGRDTGNGALGKPPTPRVTRCLIGARRIRAGLLCERVLFDRFLRTRAGLFALRGQARQAQQLRHRFTATHIRSPDVVALFPLKTGPPAERATHILGPVQTRIPRPGCFPHRPSWARGNDSPARSKTRAGSDQDLIGI